MKIRLKWFLLVLPLAVPMIGGNGTALLRETNSNQKYAEIQPYLENQVILPQMPLQEALVKSGGNTQTSTKVLSAGFVGANKQAIIDYIKVVFGDDWQIAVAIATAESGLREDAIGDHSLNPHSYGVFQIRGLMGRPSPEQLLNYRTNVDFAKKLYDDCGWYPWTVFKSGAYLRFLNQEFLI